MAVYRGNLECGKIASVYAHEGMKQGDSLSPYLFVLCMEKLSHMINEAIGVGRWKPIRASRTGPKLSHLMFVDDLILFSEASVEQAKVIAHVMQKFCNMSGQKVNVAKSSLFCSKNISRRIVKKISAQTGMRITHDLGR